LRAEERVRKEIENKKEKLAEEMKNREERFRALQQKCQAKTFNKLRYQKKILEEKNQKVNSYGFLFIAHKFCFTDGKTCI
jgi:hypothetical protein